MRHIVDTNCPKVWHDCSVVGSVCSLPRNHCIPFQSQACHVVFENVNTLGNFIKILTLSWVCIIRMAISWEYFSLWCHLYFFLIARQRAIPIQSSLNSCTLKWKITRERYWFQHVQSSIWIIWGPTGWTVHLLHSFQVGCHWWDARLPRRQFKGWVLLSQSP